MASSSKVALVTGAASGIGRATAQAFLRGGYAVALLDRDVEAGLRTEAEFRSIGDCRFFQCDVSDEAAVQHAVAQVVAGLERIDAAFNAAGIDGEIAPTADCSVANWDRIIGINLRGVFLCLKEELRQMLAQGGGAIVNCASTTGVVGTKGMPAYSASKHGVVGLTKAAALDYARNNIRINAVCPGMTHTPMWDRSISPELTAQLLADDPIGRLAEPSEIAAAVVWLCGPAASFVNGHALIVDGGFTAR
jgi:NAD(P)-dependent dehydrogenase (short-subunit alcohol dehydrogenase family)